MLDIRWKTRECRVQYNHAYSGCSLGDQIEIETSERYIYAGLLDRIFAALFDF
jgi:hypothetical protein